MSPSWCVRCCAGHRPGIDWFIADQFAMQNATPGLKSELTWMPARFLKKTRQRKESKMQASATSATSVKVRTIDCLVKSQLLFFNYSVLKSCCHSRDYLLGANQLTIYDNIIYLRKTIRHHWHNPSILLAWIFAPASNNMPQCILGIKN